MCLLEDCQDLFGSSDLYEVLGVGRSCSQAEVRRGYYRNSLKVHPDQAPEDLQATTRFQTLGKVYAVLSDAEQRATYDEWGVIDEKPDSLRPERDWTQFWKLLFPKADTEHAQSKQLKMDGEDGRLSAIIKRRAESRDDFSTLISRMEEKYCSNEPSGATRPKRGRK